MNTDLVNKVSGDGWHYSINKAVRPMYLLRDWFPGGKATTLQFCLFSTSGVHGTYTTIEEEWEKPDGGVTFVIVEPRIVRMTYGVVEISSQDDYDFLIKLRKSSKLIIKKIG